MIINVNGGGGKTNTKVIKIACTNSNQLTLPYTVTLGFKPTWIVSSGYQNTSGGGHSYAEINKNNERTFNNPGNYTSAAMYEPYVITTITDDGFQLVSNPNMSYSAYSSFYGNALISAGDGDVPEILTLS